MPYQGGMLSKIATDTFGVGFLTAQMNDPNFWANVGLEMKLMMDLCAYASDAWGPASMAGSLANDPATRNALLNARPARVGKENPETGEWEELENAQGGILYRICIVSYRIVSYRIGWG